MLYKKWMNEMNKYNLIGKINDILIYIPYSIYGQLKTFIRYLFNNELRIELKKNTSLENKYAGERLFILGNGPSLKNQNLLKLKDEFTMVTNNFYLHDDASEILPDFYCWVDPNMYNGNTSLADLQNLDNKISKTEFFFRLRAKKFIESKSLFKNKNIHYIVNDSYLNDTLNFNFDLDGCIPGTVNVIHTCLILAKYLGFSEIYLVGVDATMFMPVQEHFYELSKNEKKSLEKYDESLFYTSYMFKSYKILRKYFMKDNIKIFNATDGGVLELFPRRDFNSLFDE